MTPSMLPRVAIALGDPAGIGPEIAIKAAQDPRVLAIARPMLVGDPRAVAAHADACDLSVAIDRFDDAASVVWREGRVALVARDHFASESLQLGAIKAVHGRAALDAAATAIAAAMSGAVEAVVAAPQTETAIKAAGVEFDGYPSFVARCTGTPVEDAFLMLCFDATRIVHTTLHVSLRRAIDLVTRERVERVIGAAHDTLRKIGARSPRIAVSGLNPHASEDGMFGDEEARIIGPAVEAARAKGIAVDGPFGADTMLLKRGYDVFVVMFHDQGHNRTAGLTIGTPVLFSSVAHGSALDIAGKNQANPAAVIEAIGRLVGAPGVAGTSVAE
jgi:4-hydroxy-L-threonine phosphate dehydrogenase PdxA